MRRPQRQAVLWGLQAGGACGWGGMRLARPLGGMWRAWGGRSNTACLGPWQWALDKNIKAGNLQQSC